MRRNIKRVGFVLLTLVSIFVVMTLLSGVADDEFSLPARVALFCAALLVACAYVVGVLNPTFAKREENDSQ